MAAHVASGWESILFASGEESVAIGQRLGVPYLRAQQEELCVNLGGDVPILTVHQCSMGLAAISGVVWDCGLLLVDFLIWESDRGISGTKGRVLDLGTGTGICGLAALVLGASHVTFTDINEPPSFVDNLQQLSPDLRQRVVFVAYDWSSTTIDSRLATPPHTEETNLTLDEPDNQAARECWDTVLCSDLLYDEKAHQTLINTMQKVAFKRAVFAYKKRHDAPERAFFLQLETFCDLQVMSPNEIPLQNVTSTSLPGLFVVIATKKL